MNLQKTGAYLKYLRKNKELSQEQLAELFHVSSRTVSRWETGHNLPDIATIIELAAFYEVDILEILNGESKTDIGDNDSTDTLKEVAEYIAAEEKRRHSTWLYVVLGMSIALLVCTKLFTGETKGLLYGIVPEQICDGIMFSVYGLTAALLATYAKAHWWQEKPSKEPEKTIRATAISKEVKPGTYRSGRSKGGYSYTITFSTEDGQELELFAYEIEFGGIKEGTTGMLTYKGRYFVDFK